MFKIVETGVEFTRDQFGDHFPNVSLPQEPGPDDLESLGLMAIPDPEPIVVPPPVVTPPTPQKIAEGMKGAILEGMTALFDTTARERNYDNRITCALRAGYAGPFQAEGIAFAQWMDSQNAKGYALLAQVQAGTMPMPATVADALALLDPMVWPV